MFLYFASLDWFAWLIFSFKVLVWRKESGEGKDRERKHNIMSKGDVDRYFPSSIYFILCSDMKRWRSCDDNHVFVINEKVWIVVQIMSCYIEELELDEASNNGIETCMEL